MEAKYSAELPKTAEEIELEDIIRKLADRLDQVREGSAAYRMILRQLNGVRQGWPIDARVRRGLDQSLGIVVLRGETIHGRDRASDAVPWDLLADQPAPDDLLARHASDPIGAIDRIVDVLDLRLALPVKRVPRCGSPKIGRRQSIGADNSNFIGGRGAECASLR